MCVKFRRATVEDTPPAVKMYEADIDDDATVVAVKDSPEKKVKFWCTLNISCGQCLPKWSWESLAIPIMAGLLGHSKEDSSNLQASALSCWTFISSQRQTAISCILWLGQTWHHRLISGEPIHFHCWQALAIIFMMSSGPHSSHSAHLCRKCEVFCHSEMQCNGSAYLGGIWNDVRTNESPPLVS